MIRKLLNIVLIILSAIILGSCSTRNETPLINNDEGIILYAPKDTNGINAEIILYKGIDRITGRPLIARSFMLANEGKVYTTVKLNNYKFHNDEDLMFHIDWIDPDGNSIFMKRVDISKNDSSAEIKSAISIQPGKRDTGNYKFRVYLFRELIAEKNFRLSDYNVDSADVFSNKQLDKISAEISLGKKYDKKKEIPVDTGSVFTIKDKAKVYAAINLLNKNLYKENELIGDINWCDSNDSSFFTKKINFSPYDESSEIRSAVSINNKSRQPGKYKLKVYLYGNLIGEKAFELIPEKKEKIQISKVKGIDASIIFAGRINKKTKKCLDVSDNFVIKNKAKVHAVITLSGIKDKKEKSSKIKVEWIGPDNKSFYKKSFKLTSENMSLISSSISISPQKRNPGKYICRVYFQSSLICEKKFNLVSD